MHTHIHLNSYIYAYLDRFLALGLREAILAFREQNLMLNKRIHIQLIYKGNTSTYAQRTDPRVALGA